MKRGEGWKKQSMKRQASNKAIAETRCEETASKEDVYTSHEVSLLTASGHSRHTWENQLASFGSRIFLLKLH